MNQEMNDQGWQQIQSRIDQLVNKYLRNEDPAIQQNPHDAVFAQISRDCKIAKRDNTRE